MSKFYVKKNQESTLELFFKRYLYRADVRLQDKRNVVNFNLGEKFMYGRVSRTYVPIMLDTQTQIVSTLKNYSSIAGATPIQGMNFVVDAFHEMNLQFNKCALRGQISTQDQYLTHLTVYKGFQSPRSLYAQHWTQYAKSMKTYLDDAHIYITNFNDFLREIKVLLKSSCAEAPFTLSAFMKSKWCPITATGLAVEIADLSCANDEEKIRQFIRSPNWEFYVDTCNTYGFMIDENVPWRLVADIASPTCLAKNYSYNSPDDILSIFSSAPGVFYNEFVPYLLNLYNSLKTQSHMVTEECAKGPPITTIKTATTYSAEQLSAMYGEEYFLRLYCQIRFWEEESQFTDSEKMHLVDDTLELRKLYSASRATQQFERILNKPFDYRGSMSYHIGVSKAKANNPDEVAKETGERALKRAEHHIPGDRLSDVSDVDL